MLLAGLLVTPLTPPKARVAKEAIFSISERKVLTTISFILMGLLQPLAGRY
jgi:hypothetical protein